MTTAPERLLWRSGWLRTVERVGSANHGPRPAGANVDLIVVHSISLPPGVYGNGAIRALFTNQLASHAHPYYRHVAGLRVSSHFVITRPGHVQQYVSCDRRAWHAGTSHYRGRSDCNDDSIGIELEGLEGHAFTRAQYQSLFALCTVLAQRYPIRYLAGHEHIAPGRKHDPGARFDWQRLSRRFAGSAIVFPPGA